MFGTKSLNWPRLGAWPRLAGVLLTLPLAACQLAGPTEPPQPRLAVDPSAAITNRTPAKPAAAASDVTYTVKRGTLRDSVTVNGRVQPALSAQVAVPSAGTISSVYVRAGQELKKGDPIVDMTVDEGTLEAARVRARLADLEYETQRARVDDVKRGAGADQLSAARTAVAKAQADLQRAQLGHQQVQAEIGAVPSLKESADRDAQLAQIGLQRAKDELSAATAAVQRLKGLQQTSAQAAAQTQSEIADSAAAEASRVAAATRAAQRRVDQAAAKLEDARTQPNSSRVQQDIAKEQTLVNLLNRAVHDAEVEADRPDATKDPTGVIAANAVEKVRLGNRQLAQEQAVLDQLKASLDGAKQADDRAIRQAGLDLDQAKDELAQAQDAEQRAGQNQQRVKSGGVTTEPLTAQSQLDLPAAEARVRAAQTSVDEATVKVDQARAAQGAAARAGTDGSDLDFKLKLTDADATSAQIALDEAQASMARLQRGPAADQLEREQARATILQEEADAAHRAIQPLITVAAPFDSTVSSVSVTLGQAVDSRMVVARVAGQGGMSVVADASESDVGRLTTNQKVAVTFPGLGDGSTIDGTVIEISGAASQQSTTSDNKITYPVTVQLTSAPPGLKLGMSAAINIDVRAAQDVLFVPSNAIRSVEGQTLVTSVQSNGQLSDTPVKVGESFGANVEVLSGLREGDVVAVLASSLPIAGKR